MFNFQLSYPEEAKEEKGCSHTIVILKENQKNSLLIMKGKEPDENSKEWSMRRKSYERSARGI